MLQDATGALKFSQAAQQIQCSIGRAAAVSTMSRNVPAWQNGAAAREEGAPTEARGCEHLQARQLVRQGMATEAWMVLPTTYILALRAVASEFAKHSSARSCSPRRAAMRPSVRCRSATMIGFLVLTAYLVRPDDLLTAALHLVATLR